MRTNAQYRINREPRRIKSSLYLLASFVPLRFRDKVGSREQRDDINHEMTVSGFVSTPHEEDIGNNSKHGLVRLVSED